MRDDELVDQRDRASSFGHAYERDDSLPGLSGVTKRVLSYE